MVPKHGTELSLSLPIKVTTIIENMYPFNYLSLSLTCQHQGTVIMQQLPMDSYT